MRKCTESPRLQVFQVAVAIVDAATAAAAVAEPGVEVGVASTAAVAVADAAAATVVCSTHADIADLKRGK